MATLEKPKQKKSKKSSVVVKTENNPIKEINNILITKEGEHETNSQKQETEEQCSNVEQSGTSKTSCDETKSNKSEDTSNQNVEVGILINICEEIKEISITPSAPVFDEVVPVQYPDLPTQETSKITKPVTYVETLKPFTTEELAKLYSNSELEASKEFETCFVQSELRPGALAKHPLHELISNYALAKEKLRNNHNELERLRKELKSCEETAWIIDNSRVTGRSVCQDGTTLQATHNYQTCKLQQGVMDEINRLQCQIYRLANDNHLASSYASASLRVKIEHYLERAIRSSRVELRACLSILFRWARVGGTVGEEARDWLGGVVAALLPDADWQDHAYILCHVLRCAAGVAGWAVAYVQVPLPLTKVEDAFCDRHINHAVCVLGMLLRGVAARREFLIPPTGPISNEDLWVLVDSDGEEDAEAPFCLRENDLVALLNQIPLGEILARTVSLDDKGVNLDEHRLLRLFAFCRVLVDLLDDGLVTYGTGGPRYHQFCKRLCRLMGHILRHVCDIHELFQTNNVEVRARLQVELDSLFLHCASKLHNAERLGAWQFLAVLPFHILSTSAAWSFCYMMHTGNNPSISNINLETIEMRHTFEERISELSDEATYFLLNTYANIASSVNDDDLAQYIMLRLLDTGFICESTSDSCCKPAAALLGSVCKCRPNLISIIVREINCHLGRVGPLAIQLFRELPLHQWQPTTDDFSFLSKWLLDHSTNSLENCLARLTVIELNWYILPLYLHDLVAMLAVEFVEQHGDSIWAWQLVHKLRLHATDRNGDVRNSPELTQLNILHRGVSASISPICNYLTILMTQHGHLVPMICTHGITQLQILIQADKTEAAILAIGHFMPLFADCAPDTLANSQTFHNVLQAIINADRTYVKMAKSFVPINYEPGKNVQLIASTIEHNMLHINWRQLLVIWINILLAQPQWNKDQAVMYLLDCLVRISFFDDQAYIEIYNIFKSLLEKRCNEQEANGTSSLLSWVSGNTSWPPLLIPQGGAAQYSWLVYVCLHAEHDILERRSQLWLELLRQLRQQTGKTNVDACLRRACNLCKVPTYTSAGLCIYRWAQSALDTPLDHPLLPCLWQNFFHMYLERENDQVCVGRKFFDGVVNTTFCKKLKKRLQEAAQGTTNEKRARVYHAYSLWLDEPLIQDGSLYLPSLPVQYEPKYLSLALEQRAGERPWKELCDTAPVRQDRELIASLWNQTLGRDSSTQSTSAQTTLNSKKSTEKPLVRIRRRLAEYDKPIPPPTVRSNTYPVPQLRITDQRSLNTDLRRHIKQLLQHAELYALQRSENKALDSQFCDLLPRLYSMCSSSTRVNKTCSSCTRHVVIKLKYVEARSNDSVRNQLQTNRGNIQALLTRSMQPIAETVIASCAAVEQAAIELCHTCTPLAAELFFLLVEIYGDELEVYPPARQLFRACCATLGPAANSPMHCARLCHTILSTKSTAVSRLTAEHFKPSSDISTNDFLQMYGDLSDRLTNGDIAGELLTRLDVTSWLRGSTGRSPRLADRSKLIALIFKSLSIATGSIHDLSRSHLICVFTHEFPEHYGEVLQLALCATAENKLNGTVWRDLIAALARPFEVQFSTEKGALLSDQQLRQIVAQQRILRQDVLVDTCAMLGRYFSEERRRQGATYGLYPRYRTCIAELAALCSLVSHALVWTVVCGTGAPADRLVECTYARLVEMYGPWLMPGAGTPCLTQPWLKDDSKHAQLMLASLVSCVCFMLDAMPASRGALCQTWQFYCATWARTGVHEHVLHDAHIALARLPWKRHWPSLQDLDTMAHIMCVQQLPLCHQFTCRVFMAVDWGSWLARLEQGVTEHIQRAHACLLQLLVRLPGENEDAVQACQLLEQAQKWQWRILTPVDLAHATDWCVTSIDPRAVLISTAEEQNDVNRAVLRLLSTASCYTPDISPGIINQSKQSINIKRQCYIRSCVKLLANCAGKYKQQIIQQPQLMTRTYTHHLEQLEQLCEQHSADESECDMLMMELLQLVNCVALSDTISNCTELWLGTRSPKSRVLPCIWRTCLCAISNGEPAGRLLEAALAASFSDKEHIPNWNRISNEVKSGMPRQPPIEQQLASAGRLLALHALTLKKLIVREPTLLDNLIELSIDVKISDGVETKLPLLWRDILTAALAQIDINKERVATALRRWCSQLSVFADTKPGALRTVFSALTGGNKQPQLSGQGRLLCRAIGGYVLAQLPSTGDIRLGAGVSCYVGSPGGNTDCARLLLKMDTGVPDEFRHLVVFALQQIQDPQNSMHNCIMFINEMIDRMYTKPYLIKQE